MNIKVCSFILVHKINNNIINSQNRFFIFISPILSTWLVSRSWRAVRLHLWILSFSLIGDISNITTITIDWVGHLLQATIRKRHIVGPGGGIPVPFLISSKIFTCIIILDSIGVGILGWLIRVSRSSSSVGGGRAVWPSKGQGGKEGEAQDGLREGKG